MSSYFVSPVPTSAATVAVTTTCTQPKQKASLASDGPESYSTESFSTSSIQAEQQRRTAGGSSFAEPVVTPALPLAREDQPVLSVTETLNAEAMTAILRTAVLKVSWPCLLLEIRPVEVLCFRPHSSCLSSRPCTGTAPVCSSNQGSHAVATSS